MGDIGKEEREVTFEPLEEPAPATVPAAPVEDPELVPA